MAHDILIVDDERDICTLIAGILEDEGHVARRAHNSTEAIEGRTARPGETLPPGEISLSLIDDSTTVRIVVEDNGRGLPEEGRERLTEPYITTRSKGTGLGLAIVKKIMEDHGGQLTLGDREGGGARISLVFRRDAREITPDRLEEAAAQ